MVMIPRASMITKQQPVQVAIGTNGRLSRIRVLGFPVDALDNELAEQVVSGLLSSSRRGCALLLAANPEKVLAARENTWLKDLAMGAALILPDGIGLALVMRFMHGLPTRRVTGVDMMETVVALSAGKSQRLFVLGARPEVNEVARAAMRRRHPGLTVDGAHGYQDEEGWRKLPQRIRDFRADVLLVAMGSPKQELWMRNHKDHLDVKILQGVGGSLDVLAGHVPRAPLWTRRLGLEWLARAIREPKRLRRQWRLPFFIVLALWERMRCGSSRQWIHNGTGESA